MNKIFNIILNEFWIIPVAFILCGCASYRIPTPMGTARLTTFLKIVDMPKITYTANDFTITVEGYVSKGDKELVTVSAGAIGAIAGTAAKFMVQQNGQTNTQVIK